MKKSQKQAFENTLKKRPRLEDTWTGWKKDMLNEAEDKAKDEGIIEDFFEEVVSNLERVFGWKIKKYSIRRCGRLGCGHKSYEEEDKFCSLCGKKIKKVDVMKSGLKELKSSVAMALSEKGVKIISEEFYQKLSKGRLRKITWQKL